MRPQATLETEDTQTARNPSCKEHLGTMMDVLGEKFDMVADGIAAVRDRCRDVCEDVDTFLTTPSQPSSRRRKERRGEFRMLGIEQCEMRQMFSASPVGIAIPDLVAAPIHQSAVEYLQQHTPEQRTADQVALLSPDVLLPLVEAHLTQAAQHLLEANAQVTIATHRMSMSQGIADQSSKALQLAVTHYTQALAAMQSVHRALAGANATLGRDQTRLGTIEQQLTKANARLSQLSRKQPGYTETKTLVDQLTKDRANTQATIKSDQASIPPLQKTHNTRHTALLTEQRERGAKQKDQQGAAAALRGNQLLVINAQNTVTAAQNHVNLWTATRTELLKEIDTLSKQHAAEQSPEALVSALANALDATPQIGYGKLFVSGQPTEYDRADFTVRYRTPMAHSTLVAQVRSDDGYVVWSQTADVDGAMKDGSWGFHMGRNVAGTVMVTLRDRDTGRVMDQIQGYHRSDNVVSFDTEQVPFEKDQGGKLEADAIPFALHAARIDGPNILVVAQFPTDAASVVLDGYGSLSGARIANEGGSNFSVAQLTMRSELQTGNYAIRLFGIGDARVQDIVGVHWNKDSKTLSLNDSSKLWTPGAGLPNVADQAVAHQFDNLMSLPNIGVDNPQISFVQQMRLVEATQNYPAPLHFNIVGDEMMGYFFKAYPQYDTPDEHSHPSQAQLSAMEGYHRNIGVYQQAMGDILQNAVSLYVDVIHGGNESLDREHLQKTIDYWMGKGDMQWLRDCAGLPMPNLGNMLECGKRLVTDQLNMLVQTQADVMEYQRFSDGMRASIQRQDANGKWVAIGGKPHEVAGLNTDQVRQSARIANLITGSPDPRIVAWRNVARAAAIRVAIADAIQGSPPNASPQYVAGKMVATAIELDKQIGTTLPDITRIGTIQNGETFNKPVNMTLEPGTPKIAFFTIKEMKMVNIWVDGGIIDQDVGITIKGGDLPPGGYSSGKSGTSGESISLRLNPGTYTIAVDDQSSAEHQSVLGNFTVPLHFEISPFNSAEIKGKVSREGSDKVFDVSMRVAEFVNGARNIDYTSLPIKGGVDGLNPNKPVWVVIHGREDQEDSDNINDLAKALNERGFQVATLDWRGAAGDNSWIGGRPFDGTAWIKTVGLWAANQLKIVGFSGQNIYLGLHSWATFLGYEIAKAYRDGDAGKNNGNGFGVGGIVALDSAVNPSPTNSYPEELVNFSSVSKMSWAFRSSVFGSENRANTATANFDVMTLGQYQTCAEMNINPLNPINLGEISGKFIDDVGAAYFGGRHGYAVTLFSSILRRMGDDSLSALNIDDFMHGKAPLMRLDPTKADGVILLGTQETRGANGTFTSAVPLTLTNTAY